MAILFARNKYLKIEFLRPDVRKQCVPQDAEETFTHTARHNANSREIAKEILMFRISPKEGIQSLSWNGRVVWRFG